MIRVNFASVIVHVIHQLGHCQCGLWLADSMFLAHFDIFWLTTGELGPKLIPELIFESANVNYFSDRKWVHFNLRIYQISVLSKHSVAEIISQIPLLRANTDIAEALLFFKSIFHLGMEVKSLFLFEILLRFVHGVSNQISLLVIQLNLRSSRLSLISLFIPVLETEWSSENLCQSTDITAHVVKRPRGRTLQ